MSYLVLARKYRPATFLAVAGQEHVSRTLMNAVKRNKVGHASLLAGPRGVGKTSVARIFSKALNCATGPTATPCLKCTNCIEIAQGTSLAVREIDGASHNGVENVRELIDSLRSLPAPGSRYKIYIIDEVHMLSMAAFNALLKSLEEPPANTVFILATTEIHKIPETVISRCQQHDFRALSSTDIIKCLQNIAEAEEIKVQPEVLRMIARLSSGSMRDAQSLFDRLQSYCDGSITAAEASLALGTIEKRILFEISASIFKKDASLSLELVGRSFAKGVDPSLFLKEFVTHWQELFIAKFSGAEGLNRMGVASDDASEFMEQVKTVGEFEIQELVRMAREGSDSALRSTYPQYALEALLVRMATREVGQTKNINGASLNQEVKSGGGDKKRESSNDLLNHPKLESLKKVFPGSSIEKIRAKLEGGKSNG